LAGAVRGLLDVAERRTGGAVTAEPVPVTPGSLGSWYDGYDEAVEA
jgi:hypothetical protein